MRRRAVAYRGTDESAGSGGQLPDAAHLIEQLPFGLLLVDHAGRIGTANAEAHRILRLPASGMQTRLLADVVPSPALHALVDAAQHGLPTRHDALSLPADGRTVQLRVTATPIAPASVLLTFEEQGDTSPVVDARSNYERLRDQFISLASHELRTPLTTLLGYTYLLGHELRAARATGGESPERLFRTFAVLETQLHRLVRLVDKLVDVGRLQTGSLVIEQASLDLGALVQRVVADTALLGTLPQLRLEHTAGTPFLVMGDADRLEQVVGEILQNAAVYADGTPITLRLTRSGSASRPTALLEIEDRGMGVRPEDQQRIFRPFFQVEPWNRRGRTGLGLGLFLAREIVEQQGGMLSLSSLPGQGSTFRVELPLLLEDAAPPSAGT